MALISESSPFHDAARFRDLTEPASPRYLPVQPDFEMSCLNVVCVASRLR